MPTREEVIEAAKQAHAHRFIETELERGYETVVGPRGSLLSGGQRQRIALARAILRDPSHADPGRGHQPDRSGKRTADSQGAGASSATGTTVIITHRMATLALADRIVVMQDGRILDSARTRSYCAAQSCIAGCTASSSKRRRSDTGYAHMPMSCQRALRHDVCFMQLPRVGRVKAFPSLTKRLGAEGIAAWGRPREEALKATVRWAKNCKKCRAAQGPSNSFSFGRRGTETTPLKETSREPARAEGSRLVRCREHERFLYMCCKMIHFRWFRLGCNGRADRALSRFQKILSPNRGGWQAIPGQADT